MGDLHKIAEKERRKLKARMKLRERNEERRWETRIKLREKNEEEQWENRVELREKDEEEGGGDAIRQSRSLLPSGSWRCSRGG